MKKYDVVALGELLIDFTENGVSAQGNPMLEANPGGAPCNVLAMLNKLGKKTAFIGKVGDDNFGHMLAKTVEESGTDVTNLLFDKKVGTTLAFVHTKEDGDLLSQSRCRHDAEKGRGHGGCDPRGQDLSFWHTFVHPSRCAGGNPTCA